MIFYVEYCSTVNSTFYILLGINNPNLKFKLNVGFQVSNSLLYSSPETMDIIAIIQTLYPEYYRAFPGYSKLDDCTSTVNV